MATNDTPKARMPDDAEAYPYVLTKEIGTGSFATVFRGYHVVSSSFLSLIMMPTLGSTF